MESLEAPKVILPLLDQKLGEKLEKSETTADIRSFQLTYKTLSRTPEIIRMLLQLEFGFKGTVDANKVENPDELLSLDWYDTSFVITDYGKPEKWCRKAIEEAQKGKIVVCLVPARTNTAWFHDCVLNAAKEIRFVKGRIQFKGNKTNPTPDALVIYTKKTNTVSDTHAVVLNKMMQLHPDEVVFAKPNDAEEQDTHEGVEGVDFAQGLT